jgi:hypothetical protein
MGGDELLEMVLGDSVATMGAIGVNVVVDCDNDATGSIGCGGGASEV